MNSDNKILWYKWILYVALLLLAAIIESTWLSGIRILGASPRLLPFAVGVIAMFEGVAGGSAAGLAAGIFADAMGLTEGFFTAAYVLCGILVSILNAFTYRRTYPVSLLFWLASAILCAVLYYVFFMLILGKGTPAYIFKMLAGEFCSTILFTPFVYTALSVVHRRFATDDD